MTKKIKHKLKNYLNRWTPLIPGFRATTYFRAFILNSIAAALIATIAIFTKSGLDKSDIFKNHENDEGLKGVITFLAAFISAFVTYCILYILFHYGAGMLA